MEDVEVSDLSQTAPLLKTSEDNTLVLRKQMRTLIHVLYSTQIFKASVATERSVRSSPMRLHFTQTWR